MLPPEHGLRVRYTSGVNTITVSQPTSLSALIKPGMGAVHLAMCLEDVSWRWKQTAMELVKPSAPLKR